MDLPWIIGGGVVCAWAILRVMGSERERRVRELHYKLATAHPPEPAHSPKPHATSGHDKHPVRSKVPR